MKKIILIVGAVIMAMVIGAVVLVLALRFYFSRPQIALLPVPPEHGTSFLLESDGADTNAALKTALQSRFSDLGTGIFLETVPPTRIRVVTPMVENEQNQFALEHVVSGQLEFRLVHEDSQKLLVDGMSQPGYDILKQYETAPDGSAHATSYLVKKKPELTGKYIQYATVMHDQVGQPEIAFTLTAEGAGIFTRVTRDNIGHQLAIVVDGNLVSAPRINSEIGANGIISGHFTDGEAAALAVALNHPLPVPVKLLEMKKF